MVQVPRERIEAKGGWYVALFNYIVAGVYDPAGWHQRGTEQVGKLIDEWHTVAGVLLWDKIVQRESKVNVQ